MAAQHVAMQGRNDEARPILERAALIDPLHPSIAANVAGHLLGEGQTGQAQRIYDRLLAQPTPSPLALSAAAGFYGSIGQMGEMAARSREAALREPSFHYLFYLLQACASLGDWELADAVNDRLLRLPPAGPGRIYRRTFLPALKDQTDVALQRVREAFDELGLTIADLAPFAKAIAGGHFARGGDYAAAIEALEPIVDVDSPYHGPIPDLFSPPAHSLAWSYLHTGAGDTAARLFAAASRESHRAGRRPGSGQRAPAALRRGGAAARQHRAGARRPRGSHPGRLAWLLRSGTGPILGFGCEPSALSRADDEGQGGRRPAAGGGRCESTRARTSSAKVDAASGRARACRSRERMKRSAHRSSAGSIARRADARCSARRRCTRWGRGSRCRWRP